MPGANYMGGRRNAAKARVKDTTGRLEKLFFGQRRLCALSKGLSASKPMQKSNVLQGESSGFAAISLGHARQKIPPNSDVSATSFVPSPIHISPCTPRSRRRTKKRLEAHSHSSNTSRSAILDALDISEPLFLRGVLDRILTMPDLAGISGNQAKLPVAMGGQPLASDESSPLQRTKRKRSPFSLYEESDSLSSERPSSPSRYAQSYARKRICTPLPNKYTNSGHEFVYKERTRTFKNLQVEDDTFSCREKNTSYHRNDSNIELTEIDADKMHDSRFSEVVNHVPGDVLSSPWSSRDYRSSPYSTSLGRSSPNYMPNLNFDSRKTMNLNDNHTSLPTSIIFRGLKDGSTKRSMGMATYPVEEPTVYGTLFEQADPWDTIGQILGLSNTKPSKSLGEVIDRISEMDETETSLVSYSRVVKTEEWDEDLMSLGSDEILQVQYPPLIERRSIGLEKNRTSSLCNSIEGSDEPEELGNGKATLSQSPPQFYLRKDAEEIVQGSEDNQDYLSGDIEDEKLFSLTPLPLETSPDRIKTRVVELDFRECSERGSTEEAICHEEFKSVLAVPELQELNGIFLGPSLFDELNELEEDEI